MRLSVPSCSHFLAAIGLATSLSLTSLSAVSAVHDHEHSPLPAAAADAAQARQQATDHTQALMALQKEWANAQGAAKSRALEKLIAKAEERQAFLAELVKTNPAEVLRVAIPEEQQQRMPAEVLQFVEQKLELEGDLEVVYEDYADGKHKLRHFLKTPFGEKFELHTAGDEISLPSDVKVRARGLSLYSILNGSAETDGTMVVEDGGSSVEFLDCCENISTTSNTGPELTNTFGEQRAIVILVNFQDKPDEPWSKQEVEDVIFTETSKFLLENSSGQTWLSGDVLGWYTIPLSSTVCDTGAISSYAKEAVTASGVDLTVYRRLIYAFPKNSCSWSGRGQVGGSRTGAYLNGNMNLHIAGHELGHNFGLGHSKSWVCDGGTIEGSCYSRGYGDTLDIMGNVNPGHYNAFHKDRLGWLDYSTSPGIITAESSGNFTLSPYLSSDLGPKALKVLQSEDPTTGKKTWYFIEYRRSKGFDSFIDDPDNSSIISQNVLNGVIIRKGTDSDYDSSNLLDMTPESIPSNDFSDPALMVNSTFYDSEAGLSITTQWVNDSQASVSVDIGPQTCSTANPSMSITPNASSWVEAGTPVTYSITLTNNDSSACSANTYSLSAATPVGWSTSFESTGITLTPGESSSTDLTVTSATSAAEGFYDIAIFGANGSSSVGSTITYVVSTPEATNNPPVAADDSASTQAGVAVSIPVLSNDIDPDGDSLSVTSVSGANGTANINNNGTITYTPPTDFNGTETFVYSISDGNQGSDNATVTVSVTTSTPNQAPVAMDDTIVTQKDTPVTIDVLANDRDPDGDSLQITSVTQGSKGSVQINAAGTVTYIPEKHFNNTDSFIYTIYDGDMSASATVTVSLSSESNTTDGGKGNGKGQGKP